MEDWNSNLFKPSQFASK